MVIIPAIPVELLWYDSQHPLTQGMTNAFTVAVLRCNVVTALCGAQKQQGHHEYDNGRENMMTLRDEIRPFRVTAD